MGKKKKLPCPQCGGKLVKVRKQPQRYCQLCGHIEDILQVPGDSDAGSIPKDPSPEKSSTAQSEPFLDDDNNIMVQGQKSVQVADADHINRIRAKKAPGDTINRGMMSLPKVMVYCWFQGVTRGYRYGLKCPYPDPVWKKEMSGAQAFAFLTKVKRANRKNKLESGGIIEDNTDT